MTQQVRALRLRVKHPFSSLIPLPLSLWFPEEAHGYVSATDSCSTNVTGVAFHPPWSSMKPEKHRDQERLDNAIFISQGQPATDYPIPSHHC